MSARSVAAASPSCCMAPCHQPRGEKEAQAEDRARSSYARSSYLRRRLLPAYASAAVGGEPADSPDARHRPEHPPYIGGHGHRHRGESAALGGSRGGHPRRRYRARPVAGRSRPHQLDQAEVSQRAGDGRQRGRRRGHARLARRRRRRGERWASAPAASAPREWSPAVGVPQITAVFRKPPRRPTRRRTCRWWPMAACASPATSPRPSALALPL